MFGAVMSMLSKIPDYMHDEEMQEDAQQENSVQANLSRQFNSSEATYQRQWQEHMANTAYQRTTADLQAAGLNPMLAAGHGATQSGQGSSASSSSPSSGIASGASGRDPGFAAALQSAAQIENINAQTDLTQAQAEETRRRTPTHDVNIDKMRQEITESIERVEKIRQDVKTGASTAAHLNQQVENLKEEIPKIRAATDQLRTLANLNEAQAIAQLASAGLSKAEAAQVWQRVKQNLPMLERELGELERTAMKMAQPGHMASEAAADSLVGQIGAYLKQLLPLGGVVGALPLGRSKTIIQKPPPVIIRR